MLERITDDEVKAAIEDLPEQFRLPVYLADVEGFAYKEIAEMLDIPIGTVMSRLHRGRKGLEKRLHDFVVDQHLISTTPEGVLMGHECDDLLHELADFLHGELDRRPARRSSRDHLEDCPPCLETADFQAQLRQLIAKRCREEVPDDFRARVAAMLRVEAAIPPAPASPS